jgi:hypothetical protein
LQLSPGHALYFVGCILEKEPRKSVQNSPKRSYHFHKSIHSCFGIFLHLPSIVTCSGPASTSFFAATRLTAGIVFVIGC